MMPYASAQEGGKYKEGAALEEVVVTGSRIVRDGYSAPTPITVASTEDMMNISPSNIPDAMNKLPQFQLSSSPAKSTHNFADTASHGNVLNLRGVGGQRTLILMDGMRVPATNYRGTVDVNVLPQLLVNRVEVVTGGASAVYGSDAVAGVVNFVLDRDFTGVKGVVQGGMDAHGDNENSRFGLAGGFDFNDGKSHGLFSIEQYDNDGMLRSDREDGIAGWIYAGADPNCARCIPGSINNPYTLYRDGRLSAAAELGLIRDGAFAGQRFEREGVLVPFDPGTPTGSPGFSSGGDGYTIPYDVSAVAPLKTQQLFGRVDHEFNSNITGYAQGVFSKSEIEYSSLANSWVGGTVAPIFSGNPYLPDQVQASMGADDMITVAHYNADGPKPSTEEEGKFWMISLGLEGSFGDDYRWKAQYSSSKNTYEVNQSGLYNWQRAYAALDAVVGPNGDIVCRPSLSSDPAVAARFA
ncbi:MAG: TonB-dependent receptor plug domain-containing protein, partial [Parahaliea sp.]